MAVAGTGGADGGGGGGGDGWKNHFCGGDKIKIDVTTKKGTNKKGKKRASECDDQTANKRKKWIPTTEHEIAFQFKEWARMNMYGEEGLELYDAEAPRMTEEEKAWELKRRSLERSLKKAWYERQYPKEEEEALLPKPERRNRELERWKQLEKAYDDYREHSYRKQPKTLRIPPPGIVPVKPA